ncbi:MAG: DNA starvation/stationary phase protection protein [Gammaproteobacteria bacterium]|nr:DNA starvation/stationary phase protection protein [Gammaproteobacteria bacterium]
MATTSALKQVLADTYALSLKTQNYHWNVTGMHFKTLHVMFEEQYDELAEAVDEIAERIRALGAKTPASFSKFSALTTIKDGNEEASARAMLEDLVVGHEHVVAALLQAKTTAAQNNDDVTEDIMIARLNAHQKTLWMLRATLAN